MNKIKFKITIAIFIVSNSLYATSSCTGGACRIITPHIDNEIQTNKSLKPFNISNQKNHYSNWTLFDNAGDNNIGKNRFMSEIDIHSALYTNDTLSFFGLITNKNLLSGKVSYTYPLSWNNLILKGSYIHSNYNLEVPFPSATGIGRIHSVEGRVIYPYNEEVIFSLAIKNNNINDKITNNTITNSKRISYSSSIEVDFRNKNNKFQLEITSGYLG